MTDLKKQKSETKLRVLLQDKLEALGLDLRSLADASTAGKLVSLRAKLGKVEVKISDLLNKLDSHIAGF